MIDVNGKNNKVEQKNNKKIKTMGDVTLKGYDMTNTVTKGTGVRVHNNELMQSMTDDKNIIIIPNQNQFHMVQIYQKDKCWFLVMKKTLRLSKPRRADRQRYFTLYIILLLLPKIILLLINNAEAYLVEKLAVCLKNRGSRGRGGGGGAEKFFVLRSENNGFLFMCRPL